MKYTAKTGEKITRSTEHDDLWIIEQSKGTWYSIQASQAYILSAHPPTSEEAKRLLRENNFSTTTKEILQSLWATYLKIPLAGSD